MPIIAKNRKDTPLVTFFNEMEDGAYRFLGDDPWFPIGGVAILAGRRRTGKSTLALYECARFSRMGKKVLIVQQEDSAECIRTQLRCMRCDGANIGFYAGLREDYFDHRDIARIDKAASAMDADLVYIDPLHALAQGRWNDQRSADCILDLRAMAKRIHCCVLGIMHAKKDPTNVDSAVSGSDQWVAKARTYLYLEPDPDDPDTAVCQQVDASHSGLHHARVRFGIRHVRDGRDGKTSPVRVVTDVTPTTTTAQEYLELKGATAADRTDPVVRDEIAEWAHDTVKVNGNHMLTIDLFHQAERKDPRWSPAKVRRSFQAAGIGQGRTPEKRSRSMVYLTDPEEYYDTERDRLDNGETPEQIAKDWARANGR